MKRLLSRLSTRSKLAIGAALALVAIAIPAVVMAGFGPDRPTKVYTGPGTPGFDHVTFDSFTNVPGIGDERAFFTGAYPNGTVLTDPLAEVKDGDELTLQVLVHNNADASLNTVPDGHGGFKGIAKNTMVRVALPTGSKASQQATAYISADNAQPQQIFDTMNFGSKDGSSFSLEYEKGSAHVRGNYINQALSDNIVSGGALVGTVAADGNVKGCFQQEVLVTLKVKVHIPKYTIQKEVRFKGQGPSDWKESVNAKVGDTLEWSIKFDNLGSEQLNNVIVLDQVPAGLNVVSQSVVLYNGNYPDGYTFPDSAIQANGRQINVNIGSYNQLDPSDQANGLVSAQVIFATKVAELSGDKCGTVGLTNQAWITPEGLSYIYDTASANVNSGKECQNPTFVCKAVTVDKLDDRTVSVKVTPDFTGKDVSVESYTYNFGDGSTPKTTDQTPLKHTYAKDGTYHIVTSVNFLVKGQMHNGVTSDACAQNVTFSTETTPPSELPNTGAGNVVGIFTAVTVAGALAHRYWLNRRVSA